MTSCESYLALRIKGYEATIQVDFSAMKLAGGRCQTLKALEHSKPASKPFPFFLHADALGLLPPVLGPQPSPVDRARREEATRKGASWKDADPEATFGVATEEPRFHAARPPPQAELPLDADAAPAFQADSPAPEDFGA